MPEQLGTPDRMLEAVNALPGCTICIVGDAMVDRYVSGTIERISPEAPVPVLRLGSERAVPGGAANVAANGASLGGTVRLVSVVGPDEAASTLRALCRDHGVDCTGLVVDPGRVTTVKTRFVALDQQVLRLDHETTGPLDGTARRAVLDAARAAMDGAAVLVLSDYGKGVLRDGLAAELIDCARDLGVQVVVDPKSDDFGEYRRADVVTPNLMELARACRTTPDALAEDAAVVKAAGILVDRHGLGAMLVTLSERGMAAVPAAGEATVLQTRAQAVFDVSGAGDTVVAAVALGLAAGLDLKAAAQIANSAAGLAVAQHGTVQIAHADLVRAVIGHEAASQAPTGAAAASRLAAAWRAQGLVVGFTNGCFDILHHGHVKLLSEAAGFCDRLIVGLNSDASVTRLKGPERPIQPQAARASVLAALRPVDLVVLFEEDTPAVLIEALKPDVLIKGADYATHEIVGAADVVARGGRVVRVALEPAVSTTAIAARLHALG